MVVEHSIYDDSESDEELKYEIIAPDINPEFEELYSLLICNYLFIKFKQNLKLTLIRNGLIKKKLREQNNIKLN